MSEQNLSTQTNKIETLSNQLSELLENPDVQKYLSVIQGLENAEKIVKDNIAKTGARVEYFDAIKGANVSISASVRTTYKPVLQEVKEKFAGQFIKEAVDIDAMKKSPECADYLEGVMKETMFATKREVKEANSF